MSQSQTVKRKFTLFRLTTCALFAAVLSVLAVISVPIGVIPITLGTLGVTLAGVVLGSVDGAIAALVYLFMGAVGLPVFSGGNAGAGVLLGPTGGYLWSYPITAAIAGAFALLAKSGGFRPVVRFIITLFGCCLGIAVCYALGTIHFSLYASVGIKAALGKCVIPFIPFDFAKCVIASLAGIRINDALSHLHLGK